MYVRYQTRGTWPMCNRMTRYRRGRVSRALGDINTVAATIQQVEGYYPGSLAYRNNNPGNLMYVGQPGATQGANGLAVFSSYDAGYQALLNQINLDASRGETISQFTAKYAPASAGNDPTSYANTIASAAGLSPSDPLSAALASSDGSAALDLSSVFPSLDLSPIDFTDPTTIGVILVLGIGLVWALNA
jgi:hypothetical protein